MSIAIQSVDEHGACRRVLVKYFGSLVKYLGNVLKYLGSLVKYLGSLEILWELGRIPR